jgi:hypothetical protein
MKGDVPKRRSGTPAKSWCEPGEGPLPQLYRAFVFAAQQRVCLLAETQKGSKGSTPLLSWAGRWQRCWVPVELITLGRV